MINVKDDTLQRNNITNFPAYQERANILVSASAGSGKTYSLIERIVSAINQGISIDQLLMVTFTKKATEEMRIRLDKKIRELEAIETDATKKRFLHKQLTLLPSAKISTIDGYANELVSQYYEKINLDPVYRILADAAENSMIRQEVLDSLFEELYNPNFQIKVQNESFVEKEFSHADFMALVTNFGGVTFDKNLKEAILKLYDIAITREDTSKWLSNIDKMHAEFLTEYHQTNNLLKTKLGKQVILDNYQNKLASLLVEKDKFNQAVKEYENWLSELNLSAVDIEIDYVKKDGQNIFDQFNSIEDELRALKNADNLDTFMEGLTNCQNIKITLPKYKFEGKSQALASVLKSELDEEIKSDLEQKHKALFNSDGFYRKKLKQTIDDLKKMLMLSEKNIVRSIELAQDKIEKLAVLVSLFLEKYKEYKIKKQVLEFSDLEQYALQITANQDVQNDLRNSDYGFIEVLVDEYQDINPLQQKLLEQIAGDKLFMVGDVKQSIYRFRQADPTLFVAKYNSYKNIETADFDASQNSVFNLFKNFRSGQEVLQFNNFIFNQLMTASVGGVNYYADQHNLIQGKEENGLGQKTEVFLLNRNELNELKTKDKDLKKPQIQQIYFIAQKILSLVNDEEILVNGKKRPIKYGDIAILSRSKTYDQEFLKIFRSFDIPVKVNSTDNFYNTYEVRTILNLLKIIDNPHQDIPLVAVLRSPIFAFDENELTKIRVLDENRKHDYYQTILNYVKQDRDEDKDKLLIKKLTFLIEKLKYWRYLSGYNKITDLIWDIYETTGWLEYVASLPSGTQRQMNLRAFYQKAQSFQETNFVGLFKFIQYIKWLAENNQDVSEIQYELSNDSVNVMTIHASKGLEAPIVFLFDASKQFQTSDETSQIIIDPQMGVGLSILDDSRRVKTKTYIQELMKTEIHKQMLSEELRLLYVALTRARQKLIITANLAEKYNSWDELKDSIDTDNNLTISTDYILEHVKSFFDFLMIAMSRYDKQLSYQDELIKLEKPTISIQNIELTEQTVQTDIQKKSYSIPQDVLEKVKKQINYVYSFEQSTQELANKTVTEIKTLFDENNPDSAEMVDSNETAKILDSKDLKVPEFMQTDPENNASYLGTIAHLIFEKIDWQKEVTLTYLNELIEDLKDQKLLDDEMKASLLKRSILDEILWFVNESELGLKIKDILANDGVLIKERAFSMLLPISFENEITQKTYDDHVLLHGKIDAYLVDRKQKEIYLFDYKTNIGTTTDEIKQKYTSQIKLYERALQNMYPSYEIVDKYIVWITKKELIAID